MGNLFESHRFTYQSIYLHFFQLSQKHSWITNHDSLSQTLNRIDFYLNTFSAKIEDTIIQNKEKTTILGSCLPKGIFFKNFDYNLGYNILELYSVLIQARLTTSKPKRDIYYSKTWYTNCLTSCRTTQDLRETRE